MEPSGKHKKQLLKESSTGNLILESMPEFAYVFNKQGKLVLWNKNLESILGYSADELYKKDMYDFLEEDTNDINSEAVSKLFTDKEEQTLVFTQI